MGLANLRATNPGGPYGWRLTMRDHHTRWVRRWTAAALLLAAVLAAATGATAHSGEGPYDFSDLRLEAEHYNHTDSSCDPTGDGEHTRPKEANRDSVGWMTFIPQDGCGVTFEDVSIPESGFFSSVKAQHPIDEDVCKAVEVLVDGDLVAREEVCGDSEDGNEFVAFSFDEAKAVPAGTHDIRIELEVTEGPYWQNINVDWIEFTPSQEPGIPGEVEAEPSPEAREIQLDWQEPFGKGGNPLVAYHVYRSRSPDGPFQEVATVEPPKTSYEDTGLEPDATYHYKVSAENTEKEGDLSPADAATTRARLVELEDLPAAPSAPLPPADLPGAQTPDYPGTEPREVPGDPGTDEVETDPVGVRVATVSVQERQAAGEDVLCVVVQPESGAQHEVACVGEAFLGPAAPLIPRRDVPVIVTDPPDVPGVQVPGVPGTEAREVPDAPAREEGELGSTPAATVEVEAAYSDQDERFAPAGSAAGNVVWSPVGPTAEDADWLVENRGEVPLVVTVTLQDGDEAVAQRSVSIPFMGQAVGAAEASTGS